MCQYRLIEHFPNFLQAKPLPATQAVIESLNFFIIGTHTLKYLQEGVTFEYLIERNRFNFRGKTCIFCGRWHVIVGRN